MKKANKAKTVKVSKTTKAVKALKAVGTVAVAAGLVAGTVGYFIQKEQANELGQQLADVNTALTTSQANSATQKTQIEKLSADLSDLGLKVENFEEAGVLKDVEIAELKALVIEMEAEDAANIAAAEAKVFVGFDEDFGLGDSIELNLNDNQLEKLADYEVDVDDEDISVKEFLKVNTYFEKEDKLSLTFDEGSVEYIIEYDAGTGAVISEDEPLKIKLLGKAVEIIGIESGKLTIKSTDDKFLTQGETFNGVKVLKISEDAVLVQVGDETEVINKNSADTIGDLDIEVGTIFYVEGATDNMVNLKVGEELEKVYELTGDDKYYDAEENWKFSEIEEGRIVITNAEEFEEVSELILPNDFAKISFEVDDIATQDVKVEKEDGIITKVHFELEDYDSTYVELKDGVWEPEDDEEVIDFVTGVALKNSDFKLVISGAGNVKILNAADEVLVKVKPTEVEVDGTSDFDNDLDFISKDGLVVEPTEDFIDDEDETIVISVPEESVEATIKVE